MMWLERFQNYLPCTISFIAQLVFLLELVHKSYSVQQFASPTTTFLNPISSNMFGNLAKSSLRLLHSLHLLRTCQNKSDFNALALKDKV